MRRRTLLALALAGLAAPALRAEEARPALSPETVDRAPFAPFDASGKTMSPVVLRAQVLLDRMRFAPGEIDARWGENVAKAVAAYQASAGLPASGTLDAATFAALTKDGGPALGHYVVTEADVRGPFLAKAPGRLVEQAELDRLDYRNARELLGEKFHASEALLVALNPGAPLEKAGTRLLVPELGRPKRAGVASIDILKKERLLRAYDAAGALVGTYPASIGSAEKPAPSGEFQVRVVARNPAYYYNPDYAFKGVDTNKTLKIAPGPNNPVGAAWIDLTLESYGIHGTPDPAKVGKTFSHGCVRLTNWDVLDLAGLVAKGTAVRFIE